MTWTHGTQYGYNRKGCRCPDCHGWVAAKYAERKRRQDPDWQPRSPTPAEPEPPPPAVVPHFARVRHVRGSCAACRSGCHGAECEGCRCRCRAMLGLDGPFPHCDPTAPGVIDLMEGVG